MTLVCEIAATLPKTIVMAETAASATCTGPAMEPAGTARLSTTASAAKAAVLLAVDMKAVSEVGAPW